jgi:hypothetical protein
MTVAAACGHGASGAPALAWAAAAKGGAPMAKHSAAEVAMEAIAIESPRLPPPVELSAEERAIWTEIVDSMPPSWFDGANSGLLRELCTHLALSRQIAGELATLRRTKLTAPTAKGAKQRAAFAELLAQQREESKLISSLSVKLRLTNSSHRRDERYDDRRRVALSPNRAPWERQ